MATLKQIKGSAIQYLAEDPVLNVGSWSSGGSMNSARASSIGTATGSSNAFVAGGYTGPPGRITNTESYNGTSWTEVADIPTAYNYGNGFGTNTASVHAGADPAATTTYLWNGTSWSTPGNNLGTNRFLGGTSGTSTAGSIFGGGEPAASAKHEQWDGTSWTETTDMSTARKHVTSGLGIQTAALAVNGSGVPQVEEWDGSSWTEIAETNTQRYFASGSGIVTTALVIGGYDQPGAAYTAKTEQWNGSTWTEVNDLATARGVLGNGGSGYASGGSTDAICYGGLTTAGFSVTEEWALPPPTSTILQEGQLWFNSNSSALKGYGKAGNEANGTWASGDSINTARDSGGFFGSKNAALLAGGVAPPSNTLVEEYDGSSWTEVNNTPVTGQSSAGFGTQTAGLITGAGNPPAPAQSTLLYDGTNWTVAANLNTQRYSGGAFGTQTSGIYAGGYAPSPGLPGYANAELWNGTAWTEVSDLNDDRWKIVGAGTSGESGLVVGGYSGPATNIANTEKWDGSSWTEVNNLNTGRSSLRGGGTVTAAIVFGGSPAPEQYTNTETWNGTSWTEVADLAIKRQNSGATTVGASVGTMAVGGNSDAVSPNPTALTEDWTVDSGVVTVTTS